MSSVFDRFPTPPDAVTLGWTLLSADAENGRVRIAFDGKQEFANPAGYVQGGFLAAMLDATMGPAVLVKSDGAIYTATVNLNVSFIAPAKVGKLIGEGEVVQLGRTIAFVEGRLFDADGVLVAKATASARVVATDKLPRS